MSIHNVLIVNPTWSVGELSVPTRGRLVTENITLWTAHGDESTGWTVKRVGEGSSQSYRSFDEAILGCKPTSGQQCAVFGGEISSSTDSILYLSGVNSVEGFQLSISAFLSPPEEAAAAASASEPLLGGPKKKNSCLLWLASCCGNKPAAAAPADFLTTQVYD